MSKDVIFSIFGETDEENFKKFRKAKDRFYKPFVDFCNKRRIKPDTISYLGLFMVIPFISLFYVNPWFGLIILLVIHFLDGLDGAVARSRGGALTKGAITDITCDYVSFFAIFLTFLFFGLMSHFWAALYAISYVAMIFLVIIARSLKVKIFSVILRSKMIIYLAFLIWLITGRNYFDPVLVFFSVYMVITNYFLIKKIKCSVQ
ncbi:CDP-alcohol phosphatidyltransferase family protein [Pseudomonadota bacterium]